MKLFNFLKKGNKTISTHDEKSTSFINAQILNCGNTDIVSMSPGVAFWLWENSDTVADAVNRISWAFEQMTPVLKKKKSGEYITDHPLLELLENPGMTTSGDRLMYELMGSFLIAGECYPVITGNVNFEPVGLYQVNANTTSLIQANDGWLGSILMSALYDTNQYSREINIKRKMFTYQRENRLAETIQILNRSQKYGLRAQAPLAPVYYQTMVKYYGNIHNSGVMKNASRPGGLWSPGDGPMSQDQYKAFQNEVTSKFSGPANAGKNIIAPRPMKYENFLLNTRDMDFLQLIENSRVEIYTQYQIPLPLVLPKTMTLNNYQNAIGAFYDMSVLPRAKFLFKQLGRFLLPRYKNSEDLDLVIDEKQLPALKERLFARAKTMRDVYVYSEDEIRQETGYESLGDEGNQVWKPATLVPSGDDDDEYTDVEGI